MKRLLILLAACGGAAPATTPSKPAPKTAGPAQADVAWDALEGPVKGVEVKAADATLVPKIQTLLTGVVGKPLDRSALREATSQVFALPGVSDVTVRGVQQDDGITLELDVTPQPTVHEVTARIVGGNGLPLPGQLAAANGLPLDPVLLENLAGQFRDNFVGDGYPDASVRWTTKPEGSQVDVQVLVTPGTRVVIDHVELVGNVHAKAADLLKVMDLPAGPWNQARVERAVLLVNSYYYDHGFVNVAVETPAPSATPKFTIKEGDQYRIGKLSIKGASAADEKKWLALLGVKKGDVFSRSAMTAGLQKLQDAANAEVEPDTKLDEKKKTIDVDFALQKSVSPTSK